MSIKTKTTAAVALAALAVPASAAAHRPDHPRAHGHAIAGEHRDARASERAERREQRADAREERLGARGERAAKHGEHGKHGKYRKYGKYGKRGAGFVVVGSGASGLSVTDGALAGPFTLDPQAANRHARRFLDLTKDALRSDQTVTLGESGDEVVVRLKGLESLDDVQATDRVLVFGKVSRERSGDETTHELDIRHIVVKRVSDDGTEAETDETAKPESGTESD